MDTGLSPSHTLSMKKKGNLAMGFPLFHVHGIRFISAGKAYRKSEAYIAFALDPAGTAVFMTLEEANQALRALSDALGNLAGTPGFVEKAKGSNTLAVL